MTRPRIAVVAKVGDLARDDRIRKQVLQLRKIAEVKLFVVFNDNRRASETDFEGVPVESVSLLSRRKLPGGKYLFVKAMELYLRLAPRLRSFDIVWCHENYTIALALLFGRGRVIWDLHELPVNRQSRLWSVLLSRIEAKARFIIHANHFRRDFLIENGLFQKPHKHRVLRNFPDQTFYIARPVTEQTHEAAEWLKGDEYAYLQGLGLPGRFPFNSIAALMDATRWKIVVVGPFEEAAKAALESRFGESLAARVLFLGFLPQLATANLIASARLSVVLYEESKPNNRFCEPNRLFQALGLGIPVVVGRNEPMAELVQQFGAGVVIDTDGSDLNRLRVGIEDLDARYGEFKRCAARCRHQLFWDPEGVVLEVIT